MTAYCQIRQGPVYRREAFLEGLKAAGLNVSAGNGWPARILERDVLVIWNRYGPHHELAARFEAAGARVIVAENGYLGYGGHSHRPHDPTGRRMYAIALHDHNGRGVWPGPRRELVDGRLICCDESRFEDLGVKVKPWREGGRKVVVCAQRGVGSPGRASPLEWAERTADALARLLKIPVVVRKHPGDDEPRVRLEDDLEGAQACVIWASGAGVKALVEGVPVFYACPWWICGAGARRYDGPAALLTPVRDDVQRAVALERMAWGQWTCDEIASGDPFRRLLEMPYPHTNKREAANATQGK